MKKYILNRLIKSVFAILIVVSIVVAMVYKLVPTDKVFENDDAFRKLKGNQKKVYEIGKLEQLGYLDMLTTTELLKKAENDKTKLTEGSEFFKELEGQGYTVHLLDNNDELKGTYIAYKYYNVLQLIGGFYSRLIEIDGVNKIQDPDNPDLERGYKIEQGPNGIPALACSGCQYKYQLYINSRFPFIHQNFIRLNFGESFPSQAGIMTLDVISKGQGSTKKIEQTFPTGLTTKASNDLYTRSYKYKTDKLDEKRFEDKYANTENYYESPSMIGTSYLFGILSIILAYSFALPAAVAMARNNGKFVDKLGIVYINLLIAVPSLALIFFVKMIGNKFGLPDKFPELGFGNLKSYILPTLILALLSTPGLMMWVRRYMVDQSNADYVKFAKAKGLSRKEISSNHILKNAIIPIVNGIPSSIILAISGAVITESVFAVPGMGKMLPDSIKSANNNMVITLTFIFTTLSVFAVLIGDLLMTKVDPRISLDVREDE